MISRYSNLKIKNKRFIETFPNVKSSELKSSDDYIIRLASGQRIDQLAAQYFGAGDLWWVICIVNGFNSPFDNKIQPGILIRIPKSINNILNKIIS